MIANGADTPPFVGAAPVDHGLEQAVWDPGTGRFYVSVPATATHRNGEVDEVDPRQMKVTRVFPAPCRPAGLALLRSQRLMISCGAVLDVRTGRTLTTISGVRADEIWFNPGDDRVYFGSNPVSLVDARTYAVVTKIPVGASARATHSVAVDSKNNHVFVPVVGVGVEIFAAH